MERSIKRTVDFLIGKVYIDPKIKFDSGLKLLHISDTPSLFFSELARLIKIMKPDYIIHTGDLVDNIKLQLHPGAIKHYEREVLSLIKILENSDAKGIYISLGNHDNGDYIRKITKKITVVDDYALIEIEGIPVAFAHYASQILSKHATLYLFGHDLSTLSKQTEDQTILNGILNIYLIELETREIHYFDYPWGTDDARLNKRGFGI